MRAHYAKERDRLSQRAYLLMLPVADAYDAFKKDFPVNRIKLPDIAHFLGIRPSTLSRVRVEHR